jgi:hypothetical protein
MQDHIKARDPKGLIGRGLTPAADGPNEMAMEGYLFTLANTINAWIINGALREIEVCSKSPGL